MTTKLGHAITISQALNAANPNPCNIASTTIEAPVVARGYIQPGHNHYPTTMTICMCYTHGSMFLPAARQDGKCPERRVQDLTEAMERVLMLLGDTRCR